MALYTFYPCKDDGTSETFVTFELMDDDEAYVRAFHLLDQHPSASHVVGWCGERKAVTRARVHDDLRAVLGRATVQEGETRLPDRRFGP
jgi:hypothetical protein